MSKKMNKKKTKEFGCLCRCIYKKSACSNRCRCTLGEEENAKKQLFVKKKVHANNSTNDEGINPA